MSHLRYSTSDATSLESRTRTEQGFIDTEATLVKRGTAKLSGSSKIRDLLSYLGPRNPLPTPVGKRDIIWLMDNVAYRGPGGSWYAEFVTAAFDGKISARFVDYVGDVADAVGLAKGDQEEATIEERIVPFVMDVLPGRQIKVDFGGEDRLKLGPGGRNGITSDVRKVHRPSRKTHLVVSNAEVPSGTSGILQMKTVFAEPEGWAIISGRTSISQSEICF